MVPDSEIISEIILYSEGFERAKVTMLKVLFIMLYYGLEGASPPQWHIDHNCDFVARPNEVRNV